MDERVPRSGFDKEMIVHIGHLEAPRFHRRAREFAGIGLA
jgi:hypothetical protein